MCVCLCVCVRERERILFHEICLIMEADKSQDLRSASCAGDPVIASVSVLSSKAGKKLCPSLKVVKLNLREDQPCSALH